LQVPFAKWRHPLLKRTTVTHQLHSVSQWPFRLLRPRAQQWGVHQGYVSLKVRYCCRRFVSGD
jgi:hypothetical protein